MISTLGTLVLLAGLTSTLQILTGTHLQMGADPRRKGESGATALSFAEQRGNVAAVESLISYEAVDSSSKVVDLAAKSSLRIGLKLL